MSVAVDNTGSAVGATSVTGINITSFAVGAGSNRLIFLGVSQWKSVDTAPSATFNTSENFALFDAVTMADSGGTRRGTILSLNNPTNTTATIAVSWGGGTVDEAVCGATSWTGVDGTTPLSGVQKASGLANPMSVTVASTSDGAVHDVWNMSQGISTDIGVGNQTSRWNTGAGGASTNGAGQSATGTGSNITMTWNFANSFPRCLIGCVIAAVSAGGDTLLGQGVM
jgi:hypothetical protein